LTENFESASNFSRTIEDLKAAGHITPSTSIVSTPDEILKAFRKAGIDISKPVYKELARLDIDALTQLDGRVRLLLREEVHQEPRETGIEGVSGMLAELIRRDQEAYIRAHQPKLSDIEHYRKYYLYR